MNLCKPKIVHTKVTCHLSSNKVIDATRSGTWTAYCDVMKNIRVVRVEVKITNEAGFTNVGKQTKGQ